MSWASWNRQKCPEIVRKLSKNWVLKVHFLLLGALHMASDARSSDIGDSHDELFRLYSFFKNDTLAFFFLWSPLHCPCCTVTHMDSTVQWPELMFSFSPWKLMPESLNLTCTLQWYPHLRLEVPRRQSHCRSGLAILPLWELPLVTSYYCRLGDLLCLCNGYLYTILWVCIFCFLCVVWVFFLYSFLLQYFDTVGWVSWL